MHSGSTDPVFRDIVVGVPVALGRTDPRRPPVAAAGSTHRRATFLTDGRSVRHPVAAPRGVRADPDRRTRAARPRHVPAHDAARVSLPALSARLHATGASPIPDKLCALPCAGLERALRLASRLDMQRMTHSDRRVSLPCIRARGWQS